MNLKIGLIVLTVLLGNNILYKMLKIWCLNLFKIIGKLALVIFLMLCTLVYNPKREASLGILPVKHSYKNKSSQIDYELWVLTYSQ